MPWEVEMGSRKSSQVKLLIPLMRFELCKSADSTSQKKCVLRDYGIFCCSSNFSRLGWLYVNFSEVVISIPYFAQVLCWLVSVSCCSYDLAPQIALHWHRSAASSRHLENSVGRENFLEELSERATPSHLSLGKKLDFNRNVAKFLGICHLVA